MSGLRGRDLIPDERVAALRVATPPGWTDVALADLRATMSDHAHAEKKAALSALALLTREPQRAGVCRTVTRLAREELGHLDQVLAHLRERGWGLMPDLPDCYAGALLAHRRKTGPGALVDRMLCAALIEARSWERLNLLGEALAEHDDAGLGRFYTDLARSEAGHYRLFVELAETECPGEDVPGRLGDLAEIEADIVLGLPHEPRIH